MYEISFFAIIRLGIGHHAEKLPNTINWAAIRDLATKQGLAAIVIDGIEVLKECQRPSKDFLLVWIGEVLQNYENRFPLYCCAIEDLARFYNTHGFKMMVIKGLACGLNWPSPKHRPYGDIDIWLFGNQAAADEIINKEKGIKVDTSHHHHTTFEWEGFLIENHYDFINTKDLKSSRSIESIFKELGIDDHYSIYVNGEKVYVPSPDLHALFLIRHMALHFASVSINLRQLIDWGFFAEKHTGDINWGWLCDTLGKYHMIDFF